MFLYEKRAAIFNFHLKQSIYIDYELQNDEYIINYIPVNSLTPARRNPRKWLVNSNYYYMISPNKKEFTFNHGTLSQD